MGQQTPMQTVYRAVYKRELTSYLNPEELKKEEYSLENCINSYSGKNNIDYGNIAKELSSNEEEYFIHFFNDFTSAQNYEKALHKSSFLKEDTSIIACKFPKDILSSCKGFGIYEKETATPILTNSNIESEVSAKSSVFTEYAIPLSCYNPKENLLGEAINQTEIVPIEEQTQQQVYYDPDNYSSFF